MNQKLNLIFSLAALSLMATSTQAQCENALTTAIGLYDQGKIDDAIDMIEPCVGTITDKDALFESYRLLAIAYQDIGSQEESDEYILMMLHLRPNYLKVPNNDPAEFNKELQKFQVDYNLSLGLAFGLNVNGTRVKTSYSPISHEQSYVRTAGYNITGFGSFNLTHKIMANLGLSLMNSSIEQHIVEENIWSKTYREKLVFFDIRLSLTRYYQLNSKYQLGGGLDFGTAFMLRSRALVENVEPSRTIKSQETSSTIEFRNKFQPHMGLHADVNYAMEKSTIGLRITQTAFLRTTISSDDIYADEDFIFRSVYVPDALKLRVFEVNLRVSYPIKYTVSKKSDQ